MKNKRTGKNPLKTVSHPSHMNQTKGIKKFTIFQTPLNISNLYFSMDLTIHTYYKNKKVESKIHEKDFGIDFL